MVVPLKNFGLCIMQFQWVDLNKRGKILNFFWGEIKAFLLKFPFPGKFLRKNQKIFWLKIFFWEKFVGGVC